MRKLFHFWRIAATGFSFTFFGIGGLILRFIIFPTIRLFIRDREESVRLSRQAVRYSFIFFIHMMQALGILRFHVSGMDRLNRKGLLIIANHPSLIDIVFLLAFVEHATCIVKAGLLNNAFTLGPITAAGYISNSDATGLIEDCAQALARGSNLIVFPEGTRTNNDGVIQFHRGAANIALRVGRDITPVLIRCEPRMLTKHTKWWKIPPAPSHFHFEVQSDVIVSSYLSEADNLALAARRLNDDMQTHFNQENQKNALASRRS